MLATSQPHHLTNSSHRQLQAGSTVWPQAKRPPASPPTRVTARPVIRTQPNRRLLLVPAAAASSTASPVQLVHLQQPLAVAQAGAASSGPPTTWPGLMAALALAATALLAAAGTCFFLYIRPVMQAMTVTLAEMEAAAKEMQQAAQQVDELVGGINSVVRVLMQPTAALLKWAPAAGTNSPTTSSMGSMNDGGSSNGNSNGNGSEGEAAGSSSSSSATSDSIRPTSTTGTSSSSSSGSGAFSSDTTVITSTTTATSTTTSSRTSSSAFRPDQWEALMSGPQLLSALRSLQKLQGGLTDLRLADLKLQPSLDDTSSSSSISSVLRLLQQQAGAAAAAGRQAGSSSSSLATRTVWDALSSGMTRRAARRSLARLRSDLAAAANVLSVLLAPLAGYESSRPTQQQEQQQQQQGEQEQAQQQSSRNKRAQKERQQAQSDSQVFSTIGSGGSGGSSSSGSAHGSSQRRAVQYDEWGLPVTAAEVLPTAPAPLGSQAHVEVSNSDNSISESDSSSRTISNSREDTAGSDPASHDAIAGLSDVQPLFKKQQQQQRTQSSREQQRQQQQGPAASAASHLGAASVDGDGFDLPLSAYGSYAEHDHTSLPGCTDSGITWQHLNADPSLMHRVPFDDGQSAMQQQWKQPPQQESPKDVSLQQQQQPQQQQHKVHEEALPDAQQL